MTSARGRFTWFGIALVLTAMTACQTCSPFPEKASSYTVTRGSSAEAAVTISFLYDAAYDDYVATEQKLGEWITSVETSDNKRLPADCLFSEYSATKSKVECIASDPHQKLSPAAQKITLHAERAVFTAEEAKWHAVDETIVQVAMNKESDQCYDDSPPAIILIIDVMVDRMQRGEGSCLEEYRKQIDSDRAIFDGCLYFNDGAQLIPCLKEMLDNYQSINNAAESRYDSPELDLPTLELKTDDIQPAAPDCEADPDADGCEEFIDGAAPLDGGGGAEGAQRDEGFNLDSGGGCALAGDAPFNPMLILLVGVALLSITGLRRK